MGIPGPWVCLPSSALLILNLSVNNSLFRVVNCKLSSVCFEELKSLYIHFHGHLLFNFFCFLKYLSINVLNFFVVGF